MKGLGEFGVHFMVASRMYDKSGAVHHAFQRLDLFAYGWSLEPALPSCVYFQGQERGEDGEQVEMDQ